MTSVFVSRPTRLEPRFKQGLSCFLQLLETHDLQPRTLGAGDYATGTPLDEVIALMDECAGAIILGYPRTAVENGTPETGAIRGSGANGLHPTEWNHIEAALAYAKRLALLVIHHPRVARGIFDRGAMPSFLYECNLADPTWPQQKEISGAFTKWKSQLRSPFTGLWGYEDKKGTKHIREFTSTGEFVLYELRQIWRLRYATRGTEEAFAQADSGTSMAHHLRSDGTMDVEGKFIARRLGTLGSGFES